ncbi:22_t:CDS:2, partial [Dentiscutata heterogama]
MSCIEFVENYGPNILVIAKSAIIGSSVGIGHMSNNLKIYWTYKILYVQSFSKSLDICPMPTL